MISLLLKKTVQNQVKMVQKIIVLRSQLLKIILKKCVKYWIKIKILPVGRIVGTEFFQILPNLGIGLESRAPESR